MPIVLAFDDVKPEHKRPLGAEGSQGKTGWHTDFFESTAESPGEPTAFLVEYDPGGSSREHFHEVDQFQLIVGGSGTFGRHSVSPYCVHFARAYTPYGPLRSDMGWAFLTLRTRYDSGSQRDFDKLKRIANRTPWQISQKAAFRTSGSGVSLERVSAITDEQGLFASSLTMAPHTKTVAPDPSGGDGQYVVVVKGSLLHEKKEHKALVIAFIRPGENAFPLQAGAQGLEALVLNFPQVRPRPAEIPKPSAAIGFKKWKCMLCSFAYDEVVGMPNDGIPAGTRWHDVPDSWSCPDCAANKMDFQMVEV